MGAAYFYHLTESPVDVTLPMLLGKAQQAGWRVLVRCGDEGLMSRLDDVLWDGPAEGFLAHGVAGGPHDSQQPVLLGRDVPVDGFSCLISVAGAEVPAADVGVTERTCVIFDGHDAEAVALVRQQWKSLTDAGIVAQYWAQDAGRWVKKAEAGGTNS